MMHEAQTGATRIQLCGRLKADVRGRHVTPDLRGRQGRVLLAYLVMNRGRPVSRDELIGAIWPGEPPADPAAALRTQLSRLRSALGPESLAGRDAVELHLPEDTWIDVEAAEQAIIGAQAALRDGIWSDAWARAHVSLNISGRPFLAGFDAAWVEEVRSELAELHMRSREIVARAGVGLGGSELAGAERSARALIRAAPFRESGYLLLMRALVASGNTAEALRTFDRLRHLLSDELGSAPGAEIQALHRRLLSAHPSRDGLDRDPPTVAEAISPRPAELPLPTWLTPQNRHFVGRSEELASLEAIWAQAIEGLREIVLVGGEPGVGKTSLATEFAEQIHARGSRVLYGRAEERGSLRLQPFVEALRHWALNAPVAELRRDLGARPAALSALVPEIGVRLGDPAAVGSPPSSEDLFEAIAGTLASIARDSPVLLVIDDLHWADPDSLLAIRRIARSPHPGGLMILATHRGTEPSESLTEAIADLGRERLFRRIHLTGLDAGEVAELLGEIQGGPPDPRLAAAIHEETDGNPFLVEALAGHVATRSSDPLPSHGPRGLYEHGVPDLVREAVAHRVAELGEPASAVLEVAAVIGREFELGLLADVSGLSAEEVAGALEAALVARLVTDVPGTLDRYAFAHALFRQTVYLELPRARRTALHRRLAELLEERHGHDPRHLSQLARQFANAGPEMAPSAIEYGVRAGAGALGALVFEEAVGHYRDALGALDAADSTQDGLRCELLIALGIAESMGGDDEAAKETQVRAARLARLRGDGEALARAALGYARTGFALPGFEAEEAGQLLDSALAADGLGQSLRAMLLARRAELSHFTGKADDADEASREGLRLARGGGGAEALAAALIGRWYSCVSPGGLPERREVTRELTVAAASSRDRELQIVVKRLEALLAIDTGDQAGLDAAIEQHRLLAEIQKSGRARLESRQLFAARSLLRGDLSDAEETTAEILQPGLVAGLSPGALLLFLLRWELDRTAEMEGALRELEGRLGDPEWRAALALVLAETDRIEEARALLGDLAAEAGPGAFSSPGVLVLAALAASSLGAAEHAEALIAGLSPFAGQGARSEIAAAYMGPVDHHLGRLEALAGREGNARLRLQAAASFDDASGATLWRERTARELEGLGQV